MENTKNASLSKLIPVMLCFFAMGFVDLVGIASNYVKADLGLTDSQANIFPSLVFFWFLIFSVPTGMLMSRVGQKKTVLLSLIVTFASLLLPVFGDSYALMLISFSLLGIGNASFQHCPWRPLGKQPHFRTICESNSLFPRSIYRYVGSYAGYSFFRPRLACTFPDLHDSGHHCYIPA